MHKIIINTIKTQGSTMSPKLYKKDVKKWMKRQKMLKQK